MSESKVGAEDVASFMRKIDAVCGKIYKQMGQGHDEKVYQKALAIELRSLDIKYEKEATIELFYKNEWVGEGKADFVIVAPDGNSIVLELKAVDGCSHGYKQQLNCYMDALRAQFGMLINFWQPGNGGTPDTEKNRLVSHFAKRQSDQMVKFSVTADL